ncbi:MAG TPA: hypothetical protein VK601_27090, partial [Kofleriaceae bacterium]|nr:hypothetical protein [Kofleriaceae bacterium]
MTTIAWAAVALLSTAAGCSALLNKDTEQCKSDAECDAMFPDHPFCDLEHNVCVASGLGPKDCVLGAPKSQTDYFNACSTSKCEAFSNCERLGMCGSNVVLPPPAPPQVQTIPPLVNPV